MKNPHHVIFFLTSLTLMLISSCENKTGSLLHGQNIKPQLPNFETYRDTSPRRPVSDSPKITREEDPMDASGRDPTAPPSEPFADVPVNVSEGELGDVPTIPIPTDDDFYPEDDLVHLLPDPHDVVVGVALCGNGHVDLKEQCDDGNDIAGDGCNEICRFEICGNRFVDAREECDDGNDVDGDGCNKRCEFEVCGNKRIDVNEECDDGNLTAGDGCSPCCKYERCGNGVIDTTRMDPVTGSAVPFEECDDFNITDGDGCSAFCQKE